MEKLTDLNKNIDKNIENRILSKIRTENLHPKSFWYFVVKDYSLWGLVFLSIILASISIAPIIFIINNLELGYAKHIDSNIFFFLFHMFPYTWILLCAITTVLATIAWENTKHGYRFDGKKVFVISLLISLGLGIVLHTLSFGKKIDDEFKNMSLGKYKSFEEQRDINWFNPTQGRLIGIVETISTSSFILSNKNNNFSESIFVDISVPGSEFVGVENKVRVIGFFNNSQKFIACGILPDNLRIQQKLIDKEIRDKIRDTRDNKIKQIFETYPECKDIFDQGRAKFRKN